MTVSNDLPPIPFFHPGGWAVFAMIAAFLIAGLIWLFGAEPLLTVVGGVLAVVLGISAALGHFSYAFVFTAAAFVIAFIYGFGHVQFYGFGSSYDTEGRRATALLVYGLCGAAAGLITIGVRFG